MSRQPSLASSVSSCVVGSMLCGGLAFAQGAPPFGDIDALSNFLAPLFAHLLHGDPVRCAATLSATFGTMWAIWKYAPMAPWRREVNDTNATLAALSARLDALELSVRHTGPPSRQREHTPPLAPRRAEGPLVWSKTPTLDPATPDVDYLPLDEDDPTEDATDTHADGAHSDGAPRVVLDMAPPDPVLQRIVADPPPFLPSRLRE